MATDQRGALQQLLLRVEILARNGKLDTLGLEWTEAMQRTNDKGLGVVSKEAKEEANEIALPDFDLTLLERGGKSRSGYAGIYGTSGGSFRALVADPDGAGSKYLASRKTAIDAAIDRYRWYEEHGIAYGRVGLLVSEIQRRDSTITYEAALMELTERFTDTPGYEIFANISQEAVERTLRRYRERQGPSAPTNGA